VGNQELAAALARELFKFGSEGLERPCQRIQFMGGSYKDKSEYGMGGLIEPALARCLREWLDKLQPVQVETSVTTGDSHERTASLAGDPADASNLESGNLPHSGRGEVSRGDQQQPVSHAERMFRSHPEASGVAHLIRSRLFQTFLGQGFWHAHHVDLVWRYNGQDVREEADWLKDLWYAIKGAPKTAEPSHLIQRLRDPKLIGHEGLREEAAIEIELLQDREARLRRSASETPAEHVCGSPLAHCDTDCMERASRADYEELIERVLSLLDSGRCEYEGCAQGAYPSARDGQPVPCMWHDERAVVTRLLRLQLKASCCENKEST
jgi:hypothetical protein